ncbi:MAG TPA: hypothetical protein VNO70_14035 [Blastocatellia bacterium]|nr:hypothetical protein [Blastocatellia bacterium]
MYRAHWRKITFAAILPLLFSTGVYAQEIRVSPSEVNAYSQGATTVFLTFGGLNGKRPAEAEWCGDIIPAAPDFGFRCNPATVFGRLPARYDRSRLSGNDAYTDIMSITPSVARRSYVDAASGNDGRFFYVRRFVSPAGGPDEYVPVTIRLSGNGARVPFSLTNVKLLWDSTKPVQLIKAGEKLPAIRAEITYTGTGRLKGRWEIVKPGERLPDEIDLLTEATLPIEQRARQRRFTQLSRFNVFLPPTGKYILPGPETWRLDNHVGGMYLVLLRIEATDDREGDSDLGAVGAGQGIVHTGGVAGFALPTLRYYVGSSTGELNAATSGGVTLAPVAPADNAAIAASEPITFTWREVEQAALYRLEVLDAQGRPLHAALVLPGAGTYLAPPWFRDRATDGSVRWRVVALDGAGKPIFETALRTLRLAN